MTKARPSFLWVWRATNSAFSKLLIKPEIVAWVTPTLVANSVSGAPGFHIGNVYVLAGVPAVMRAMLDAIAPDLPRGVPVTSVTLEAAIPEGRIAPGLAAVQKAHMDVSIGSYPFTREGPQPYGAQLVVRGRDADAVERAALALDALLRELGAAPQRVK